MLRLSRKFINLIHTTFLKFFKRSKAIKLVCNSKFCLHGQGHFLFFTFMADTDNCVAFRRFTICGYSEWWQSKDKQQLVATSVIRKAFCRPKTVQWENKRKSFCLWQRIAPKNLPRPVIPHFFLKHSSV